MKRSTKFYSLLGVYLVLMLLDGLLTYINTPDLAREGNPLVAVFGLGWGALFLANLIVFLIVFFMGRYAFVKYETLVAPAANRREYVSQLFFDRPDKFTWFLYRLPKRWAPFGALMGYVLIPSAILNRAILVLEWLAADTRVPVYDDLRAISPYGRLDMVITLLFMVFLFFFWFDREYKRSRSYQGAPA